LASFWAPGVQLLADQRRRRAEPVRSRDEEPLGSLLADGRRACLLVGWPRGLGVSWYSTSGPGGSQEPKPSTEPGVRAGGVSCRLCSPVWPGSSCLRLATSGSKSSGTGRLANGLSHHSSSAWSTVHGVSWLAKRTAASRRLRGCAPGPRQVKVAKPRHRLRAILRSPELPCEVGGRVDDRAALPQRHRAAGQPRLAGPCACGSVPVQRSPIVRKMAPRRRGHAESSR
jgi:hypothetical protein